MSELVRHFIENKIATVTLNRPELHNAFNEVVIEELSRAFNNLGRNPDVRVIVLTGEGKSFCAGADVNWMKRMINYSVADNIADATTMARMLRSIRDCPKPVIARIHGAAFGGGVGLAAACDIAVAVDSASFCLSEVKLGIIPAVISPYVMEKIGPGHMRRYGLTAERFSAAEAHRIGLVSEVVESEQMLDTRIADLIAQIKTNGPEALAVCKQVLTDVYEADWDNIQQRTTRFIAERRVSPEGQEGLKAFLEKRPANWVPSE